MTERGSDWSPRPFSPPWWLRGPHAQTLAGKFLRPTPDPGLRIERWGTPDGDFLDLEFTPDPGRDVPLVMVLHGLEGSSRRRYVRLLLARFVDRGMAGVALNFRGCSGEPNRTPRAYHSGETTDPALVLERLRERFPDRPLGAVGYSLGGNVLLKLLGEQGGRTQLGAAVAVSVPYDLAAGAELLERSFMGRVYTRYFLRSLKAKARAKGHLLRDAVDLDRVSASRTLREFDDALTAPLHDFPDAATYYARSSSSDFLRDIAIPTLLIHARDDPFLPVAALPDLDAVDNPALKGVFVEHGGHVGFVHGSPAAMRFWAEEEATRFLGSVLAGKRPIL